MINIDAKILKKIAGDEKVGREIIRRNVNAGTVVILNNKKRKMAKPCAVGFGLRTKINANIGLSSESSNINLELKKLKIAVEAGADAVMDLSTGPLSTKVLKKILANSPVPIGTVPVYELACGKNTDFLSIKENDFLEVLKRQAEAGVDFFTIHSGITLRAVDMLRENSRIISIVSRGGALLASWMIKNKRENPFFSKFDEVLDIAKKYNIVLSLGDSLRPGAIADATDRLQIEELLTLGDLQKRALKNGVQVMIEGPGHVPLDQIEANVKLEKAICHGAPFYVLGPLVTDAAPGYDHIVSAIGGAIAAWHGADFLCYVTPAEHLKLPNLEDVRQGIIASKIAAHAADIVKNVPLALERDVEISKARERRDWQRQFELSLDAKMPSVVRKTSMPKKNDVCTMCSDFCSMKMMEENLKLLSKNGKRR
ncbi:MAG: phosphomethylpyrimidine synthase ThiC [Candidatus Omnitrophica bacterium]|nr:phosphomethylpyrimidine synthase ThiC [Candidatus Omnitrophota bacterium]